jgi:pimeloyl-ACP methyl ester carboxylesterase
MMALAALAGWVVVSPPRLIEAASLLYGLATGQVPAATPEAESWAANGRRYSGDLYGAMDARAAILLVPGAAETGKDDPRLIAFARGLAAHRFLVLVPDLPGPKALRISSEDIVEIVESAAYLAGVFQGRGPLGIAAISYGVGPAILAARDERIGGKVGFVAAAGGYYDAARVVTFFTTGFWRERDDEAWRRGRPNAYGKWVFVLANAARLDDWGDRERIAAIARAKLRDLTANVAPIEAALGPEGRAVMALLDNPDPELVPQLIATLPTRIQAEIAALDLANKDLSAFQPRVLLIHGRDDAIVPYSESMSLARALGPGARLFLLDSLSHASLTPGSLRDVWRLWLACDVLLRLRDGG